MSRRPAVGGRCSDPWQAAIAGHSGRAPGGLGGRRHPGAHAQVYPLFAAPNRGRYRDLDAASADGGCSGRGPNCEAVASQEWLPAQSSFTPSGILTKVPRSQAQTLPRVFGIVPSPLVFVYLPGRLSTWDPPLRLLPTRLEVGVDSGGEGTWGIAVRRAVRTRSARYSGWSVSGSR